MNTCHHPFHLGFFHDPSKPPTFLFFCFLLIHTSHTKTGVHKTNEKNIKEKHEKKHKTLEATRNTQDNIVDMTQLQRVIYIFSMGLVPFVDIYFYSGKTGVRSTVVPV